MKKLLALLMAALMLTGAALAEEDDWYLNTAEELAACVGELVGDEAYQQLMSGLEFEELDALKGVDYTAPVAAWRIEWSAAGDLLLALYSTVEAGDLSDAGRDRFDQLVAQSLLQQANSAEGANWLAVSTMLTYSRTYLMPEDFQMCTYLLEFDGGLVGVVFRQTGDETITATAQPVSLGDRSVEEWLQSLMPLQLFSCEQVMGAQENTLWPVQGE